MVRTTACANTMHSADDRDSSLPHPGKPKPGLLGAPVARNDKADWAGGGWPTLSRHTDKPGLPHPFSRSLRKRVGKFIRHIERAVMSRTIPVYPAELGEYKN